MAEGVAHIVGEQIASVRSSLSPSARAMARPTWVTWMVWVIRVTEVVTVGIEEHLGLVLQTAEGLGMDDPVTIPFEGGAELVWLLLHGPASGLVGLGGQLGQQVVLETLPRSGACSTDEKTSSGGVWS